MKTKLFPIVALLAVVFAVTLSGCQKDQVIEQDEITLKSTSASGVVPVLNNSNPGGNVDCDGVKYAHTSGRINFENGAFVGTFPPGFEVTVSQDGLYVSWSYTPVDGMCLDGVTVIVKGGNASNVYTYPAGINSDSGLSSPVNQGGNIAGLSNLTFCYNLTPCEELVCWKGETAWGGNTGGGGSAWWFYYDTRGPVQQKIHAGQKEIVGAYVEVVGGIMNIVLGPDMRLADVTESVKVQGYTTIPTSRPAAGRFTTYKGTRLSFPVPAFRFYAIHLDVEVKIPCPPVPPVQ